MGGPEMLTHHIAAFLSVALASFTGQAHLYTLLLLSTELTTPFVNARWFYDQLVCCLLALSIQIICRPHRCLVNLLLDKQRRILLVK